MQKLVWQNSIGDSVDLTSGNYGITEWEGFSNAPLNIQSQQVPFQDGAVFLDALMEQRELSVTLKMQDNGNLENRYRMRRELIHILNPKLGEGYLIYTNDYTSKRIKCIPQIPLFKTHNSNDSGTPEASLAWTACEPYWEDIEPLSVPLSVGVMTPIDNEGDLPTNLEINLFISNCKNPKIENLTTGKSIKLEGTFNDNINININMGKKTVNYETLKYDYTSAEFSKIYYFNKVWFAYRYDSDRLYISNDKVHWNIGLFTGGNIKGIFIDKDKVVVIASTLVNKRKLFISENVINWNKVIVDDREFNSITYSNTLNLYIGVGLNIYTSSDLINWAIVYEGGNTAITSVCCNESKICALYKFPTTSDILVSENGIDWSHNTFQTSLSKIIYSEDLMMFCAVGNNGAIVTSTDAENWTQVIVGNHDFNSIVYHSGVRKFFVSSVYELYSSNNGISWDFVKSIENGILSIADYSIYLYESNKITESTDGINWNLFMQLINIKDICYSNKLQSYFAIGTFGDRFEGRIYKSKDLKNWEVVFESSYEFNSICYSEKLGKFCATNSSSIYVSDDGNNWVKSEDNYLYLIKVIKSEELSIFFGWGRDGYGIVSNNGVDWTVIDIAPSTISRCVCSEKKKMLLAVVGTTVYISRDGYNWETHENTNIPLLTNGVIVSESLNIFLSYSNSGNIGISTDGINWSIRRYQGIMFRSGIFSEVLGLFCFATNNGIYTSPNGINLNIVNSKITNEGVTVYSFNNKEGFFLTELSYYISNVIQSYLEKTTNIISALSNDSDMSMGLEIGLNELLLTQESGGLSANVKYRPKYIGV